MLIAIYVVYGSQELKATIFLLSGKVHNYHILALLPKRLHIILNTKKLAVKILALKPQKKCTSKVSDYRHIKLAMMTLNFSYRYVFHGSRDFNKCFGKMWDRPGGAVLFVFWCEILEFPSPPPLLTGEVFSKLVIKWGWAILIYFSRLLLLPLHTHIFHYFFLTEVGRSCLVVVNTYINVSPALDLTTIER